MNLKTPALPTVAAIQPRRRRRYPPLNALIGGSLLAALVLLALLGVVWTPYDPLKLDLLSRLRNDGATLPVLILTARDGVEDRILGLDRGGDDYLAKPFALGELEARLRALSRRRSDAPAQKRLGRLCFDSIRNEVQVDGQRIELTARELALVDALMQHPGRTVTKQRLFDALYSWDHEANLSVIEVHVSRLRRKLEQARAGVGVRMLRGLGYRLEAGGD